MLNIRSADARLTLPTDLPLSNLEFAVGAPVESSVISEGAPVEGVGTSIQVDGVASMANAIPQES